MLQLDHGSTTCLPFDNLFGCDSSQRCYFRCDLHIVEVFNYEFTVVSNHCHAPGYVSYWHMSSNKFQISFIDGCF